MSSIAALRRALEAVYPNGLADAYAAGPTTAEAEAQFEALLKAARNPGTTMRHLVAVERLATLARRGR